MSRRERSTDTLEASSEGLAADLVEMADAANDDDVLDLSDGSAKPTKGKRAKAEKAPDAGKAKKDKKAKKKSKGDDAAVDLYPEPVYDEVMHHGGAMWSITVAVSLSLGLIVSGDPLLAALEGTGDIGAALIRLALVSTVAMVGISGITLLFQMFSMPADAQSPVAEALADALPEAAIDAGTTDSGMNGA